MPVYHAFSKRAGLCSGIAACALVACSPGAEGTEESVRPFDGIASEAVIYASGASPAWAAVVRDGEFQFEDAGGSTLGVAVQRFAGNNGVSFTGERDGRPVLLMVTPGKCRLSEQGDEREFVATMDLAGERFEGCAEARPALDDEE